MLGRNGATALGTFAVALALSLGAANLQAASACKGLEKKACGNKSDCTWVDPYTRKDGGKVSGHCKSKPKKSNSKKKSDDKKKSESKK